MEAREELNKRRKQLQDEFGGAQLWIFIYSILVFVIVGVVGITWFAQWLPQGAEPPDWWVLVILLCATVFAGVVTGLMAATTPKTSHPDGRRSGRPGEIYRNDALPALLPAPQQPTTQHGQEQTLADTAGTEKQELVTGFFQQGDQLGPIGVKISFLDNFLKIADTVRKFHEYHIMFLRKKQAVQIPQRPH